MQLEKVGGLEPSSLIEVYAYVNIRPVSIAILCNWRI